ncbi:MAG TPA: hypothetical protein VJ224_07040 [Thermoplasmata archaeon]|nr:hypothetical protein [Thermoplasmata archaeon]HLA46622.1 hypothetical protein [Thermoplasmata archaeon]
MLHPPNGVQWGSVAIRVAAVYGETLEAKTVVEAQPVGKGLEVTKETVKASAEAVESTARKVRGKVK